VELERDVMQALDETAQLAQRIYPPLLETGGLPAALRSAAVRAVARASIDVAADATYPPEVAGTVYLCWLEALECAGAGARATITVRTEKERLVFDLVTEAAGAAAALDRLRDRVDALGGRLIISSAPGGGTRLAGSLPLPP
jgi:signal transduction histidine kinase